MLDPSNWAVGTIVEEAELPTFSLDKQQSNFTVGTASDETIDISRRFTANDQLPKPVEKLTCSFRINLQADATCGRVRNIGSKVLLWHPYLRARTLK